MSNEIIKDRPKRSDKDAKDEYTPEPSRTCDFMEFSRISEIESEIIHCDKLADYRVKLYSARKYILQGLGGEPAKASDYESLIEVEYLCQKHFNIKYKYSPQTTPKMSYLKIIR